MCFVWSVVLKRPHYAKPDSVIANAQRRQTAHEIWVDRFTKTNYWNGSKYNYQTAKKRFGSWEKVLQKAGLETEKSIHGIEYGETSLKTELLIDDLISVSKKLNNPKFTIAEYDEYGKYGSATIQKRFRGWNNAKRKANLEIGRNYNTPIEDYLQNILI